MDLDQIPKPDLQSIQSASTPQSPMLHVSESPELQHHHHHQQQQQLGSSSKDSILPPSNLTDAESMDELDQSKSYNNNTISLSSNHHITDSSNNDLNSENNYHTNDHDHENENENDNQQLLLTTSNTSSKEAIPVTVKLSQLPNTSSSSLLIRKQSPSRKSFQMTPVSIKLNHAAPREVDTSPIDSLIEQEVTAEPIPLSPHIAKKRTKSATSPQLLNFETPQFSHNKRESTMSTFSHYSGMVAEDDAVPMTVKRSSSSKIKYVHHKKGSKSNATNSSSESKLIETSQLLDNNVDDITDEEDQSSINLGKLPTTSISGDDNDGHKRVINPEKSYVTSIEGSIPARSPRRPTSMIVSNFNIDDVSESQQPESGSSRYESVEGEDNQERRQSFLDDNKRRSIQINDGLEKLMMDASSINDDTDLPNQEHDHDTKGIGSRDSSYVGKAYGIVYTDTESQDLTPKYDSITNDPVEGATLDHDTKSIRSNNSIKSSQSNLPPRPKPDDIIKARRISSNLQQQQQQQQKLRQQQQHQHRHSNTSDYESPKLREIQSPNTDNKFYSNQDYIPTNQENLSNENIQTREVPEFKSKHRTGMNVEDIESSTTIPQQQQQQQKIMVDDEGYYDIDEPILMKQPSSRAKSVKKSIKRPSNSIKHKKKSKNKKNELRPFNYSTLISLLESMNGTIIGEEFNNLDIPIKEKQLIEKIIDSLSRLTSDMIIDQTRYDVGIERLEKCLRVLEGFL